MIQKHTLPNNKAAIYGETANINYFLKEALEADASDGVINVQSQVAKHNRRRYKGDPDPSEVSAHPRISLYDPGRRNGAATPGKNMLLSDGKERRAFTYVGPWIEVHAYLTGNAKMDLMAYSESARYDIAAVSEGGMKAAAVKTK